MKTLSLLALALLCGGCSQVLTSDDVSVESAALTPQFVQIATGGTGRGSPSSVHIKMPKAQKARDTNVVAICWNTSDNVVASVTDTKGNHYASQCAPTRFSGNATCVLWAAFGIAPAAADANTVTVKWASGALDPDVRVGEYSGLSSLDACAGSGGVGSLPSSGPVTTSIAGDLLVGSNYVASMTTGPGSGYRSRVITSDNGSILEDMIAGAPGSYSATAPQSQSRWYVMQVAAFKPSGSAPDAGQGEGVDARADSSVADAGQDGPSHGGSDASSVEGSSGEGGAEAGLHGSVDAASAGPDGEISDVDASNGDAGSGASDATLSDVGPGSGPTSNVYPLSISPNKEYLVDVHGNPWFMQGDTAWSLEAQPSQADMLTYLNDRQSRGYNATIVQVMEHKFTTHNPPWLDANGDAPFTAVVPGTGSLDFTTPNEAYFKNIDYVLQTANSHGMAVLLFPAYLGYACLDEGWCGVIGDNGVSRMTTYGTYLGNRYKNQPNIIWVLGGDDTPSGTLLSEVNAIAQGIRSAGDTHLMTAHWGVPSGGNEISAADISPLPSWLQIDDLYTYDDQTLYHKAWSDYARDKGVRPEFLIESDYEGEHPNNPTTSDTWRAEMYEPALAGGFGFVFGNNPLWPFAIAGDGNPGWNNAISPNPTGYLASWRTCLTGPGSQDGERAGAFFRSLPWWTWVPDTNNHTLLNSNDGVCSYVPDGTLAVIYLSSGGNASVNMASFAGPTTAQWFDPSSGQYTRIAGSPFANSGDQTFTPPARNSVGLSDFVLLLEAP